MSKETKTVHFRIAERFGILLVEIAQEHLTERNNPVQALKTITDSLHGCPTELAVPILKGDIVLNVDVENQQVLPTKRIPELHDKLFPKLDPLYWIERRKNEIEKYGEEIITGFRQLQTSIRRNYNKISLDLSYDDVFKFVSGKNEDILDSLRENAEIDCVASLFDTTKRFIELTMSIQSTMDWMLKTFDEFSDSDTYTKYLAMKGECSQTLTDVMSVMKETLNFEFRMNTVEGFENVQKYIDSAIEIDEIIKEGIEPVDILDNWSAGWLSPEGEYYALNGEIANMLHNQLADEFYEMGIIPAGSENKNNPDGWLMENGWVKIHGKDVCFDGYFKEKFGKKNIPLTAKQIDAIEKYAQTCCDGWIKLNWQEITGAKFGMIARNNPELLKEKYFTL